jgi:hypothetical protein
MYESEIIDDPLTRLIEWHTPELRLSKSLQDSALHMASADRAARDADASGAA